MFNRVLVGILDTGIDYLNEEFIKEDNKTRIIRIWDQTIRIPNIPSDITFVGQEYTEEQINKAIKLSKEGKDAYTIVPEKDEIVGHGKVITRLI